MAETYFGHVADGSDDAAEKARAIDLGLTWVRPAHRRSPQGPWRWLSVEQELIDLYARYERACAED